MNADMHSAYEAFTNEAGPDESPVLSPKELVSALEVREQTAFAAYKEAVEYSNMLFEYWSDTCTQLYAARDKVTE